MDQTMKLTRREKRKVRRHRRWKFIRRILFIMAMGYFLFKTDRGNQVLMKVQQIKMEDISIAFKQFKLSLSDLFPQILEKISDFLNQIANF